MNEPLNRYAEAYEEKFEYSFDNNIILNWYPKQIIEKCRSEHSLLELGIGHGFTTNFFSQYFSKHVVIDGSGSVIQRFRDQYPQCRTKIIESYFEHYDSEEKFDVIVMGFVLEHVDNPAELLVKYKKFLKPEGRCFIAVPNGESLHRRLGHEAGFLPNMMTLGHGDLALGHLRLYSVDSLSSEVTKAGYRIIHTEGIFLKPLMTTQLQALELDEKILQAMCKIGIDYPELSCALLFEAKV